MIIGRKLEIVGLLKASHISLWGMPIDTFSLALFYLFLRTVLFTYQVDSAKKNALHIVLSKDRLTLCVKYLKGYGTDSMKYDRY